MSTTHQGPVTRTEIADAVEPAFDLGQPAERDHLIRAAASSGARREVVVLLERLPAAQFATIRELWRHISDVPVGS